MGFLDRIGNFFHFEEDEYWDEICVMDETRLRVEHKLLQQKLLGIGAAAGVSGVAAVAAPPLLAITAISGRRTHVNIKRRELVEQRLAEKGWDEHELRFKDVAMGVGPTAVAEMVLPASSAVVGHAAHHITQQAAHHGVQTAASQHVAQAAAQHSTQIATEEAAKSFVQHHTQDALSAVCHNASIFGHAAAEAPQSELFTLTHGLLGHASQQGIYSIPLDASQMQAWIMGTAAGQMATVEAGRKAIHQGVKYATGQGLKCSMDRKKGSVITTEVELSDDSEPEPEPEDDTWTVPQKILKNPMRRAVYVLIDLLNEHYEQKGLYDEDGSIKNHISLINTCGEAGCDCPDYDDSLQSPDTTANLGEGTCLCGHAWGLHERHDAVMPAHLCQEVVDLWYPRLNHTNSLGATKTLQSEIEPCNVCGCQDYNHLDWDARCECSHDARDHWFTAAGEWERAKFVLLRTADMYQSGRGTMVWSRSNEQAHYAKRVSDWLHLCALASVRHRSSEHEEYDLVYKLDRKCIEAYEVLFREAVVLHRTAGPKHILAIAAMESLACLWHLDNRLRDAASLYQLAVQRRESILGSGHISRNVALQALMEIAQSQGESDGNQAEINALYLASVPTNARHLSARLEHALTSGKPERLLTSAGHSLSYEELTLLAGHFDRTKQYLWADNAWARAVLKAETVRGTVSFARLHALQNRAVGCCGHGVNFFEDARKGHEALSVAVQLLGPDHVETLKTTALLAFALVGQGKPGKEVAKYALMGLKKAEGDHQDMIEDLEEIVEAL